MIWFLLYMFCMLLPCLKHLTSSPGRNEYFICGRQAGTGLVSFSLLASCIGGSATIGMIGLAWQNGWPAICWLGSGAIGLAALGLLLAARIRATRASTMPEIISGRLGPACRHLAAIIILVSSLPIIAAQFNALAILLASLSGLDFLTCMIAGAASVWAYTCLGGQMAVMKSDLWQFLILAAALLLTFIFLLRMPACRHALAATPFELFNNSLPPARAIYFLLIYGSSFFIGPMLFGRILSARNRTVAKTGTLWAALGLAIMSTLIAAIGIAISGLDIVPPTREDAFFAGIHAAMPAWATIPVTLGLISAVVSSADSCLLTAATIWTNDIRKKGDVRQTRQVMSVIAILSALLVFCGKGILGLLLAASDIYVCGIVCPVLVALLSGRKTNAGW